MHLEGLKQAGQSDECYQDSDLLKEACLEEVRVFARDEWHEHADHTRVASVNESLPTSSHQRHLLQ